jgi:hypothetical protein
MQKNIYHISEPNTQRIMSLMQKIETLDISCQIGEGGIHLFLDDNELKTVENNIDKKIELGILPDVHKSIIDFVLKTANCY